MFYAFKRALCGFKYVIGSILVLIKKGEFLFLSSRKFHVSGSVCYISCCYVALLSLTHRILLLLSVDKFFSSYIVLSPDYICIVAFSTALCFHYLYLDICPMDTVFGA
ncbi:hypothetical protein ACOSQ3_006736 [Xanthoceras sorbifolium]